ncbi:MAG: YitT family protein [Ruminococcaceae bacterium]|nr:YitT family protein [Oscillospiraceae bacterium]
MKKIPSWLRNYIQIIIGALMFAAGISLFLAPNSLAAGGISGVAIIIVNYIKLIPVGTWVIIFNVPIMIAGVWKLGFKILIPTIVTLAISTTAMNLFESYVNPITDDPFLAAISGGVLVATGIGLLFRGGATSGGTDIIVKLLRLKFPHISTGTTFLIADGAICLASGLVFGNIENALYAGISLFVQMFVLNMVLYGSDQARIVYIISEKDSVIAKRLLEEIDAGATYLYGCGAYTNKDKKVLMCTLRMRMLPQARDIVREEDTNAFMIVTKATGVFGEGFKSHTEEDL